MNFDKPPELDPNLKDENTEAAFMDKKAEEHLARGSESAEDAINRLQSEGRDSEAEAIKRVAEEKKAKIATELSEVRESLGISEKENTPVDSEREWMKEEALKRVARGEETAQDEATRLRSEGRDYEAGVFDEIAEEQEKKIETAPEKETTPENSEREWMKGMARERLNKGEETAQETATRLRSEGRDYEAGVFDEIAEEKGI